ncbi:pyridoxine 5'-phosphate synthase [Sphingomonas sp. PP-CC-1A-547]|nr:pyridoxine 5'-phosphate synthase [Sphingomonas sp. PP-CC-1A-547]
MPCRLTHGSLSPLAATCNNSRIEGDLGSVFMARLSVNLNKVALLRNSRRTGVPDLLAFARIAHEAGADGITVHPRPDQRHIRDDDVSALAEWMKPLRPTFELNIEGYPDDRLFRIVSAVQPEQCTLVPDPPSAFTSEEGWKFDDRDAAIQIYNDVARFQAVSGRVILFIDPDPTAVRGLIESGADGAEIYTGSYAAEHRANGPSRILAAAAEAARALHIAGLRVNVGHDLNLANLSDLIDAMPPIAEASIGHELTADALVMGFGPAVAAYKAALG